MTDDSAPECLPSKLAELTINSKLRLRRRASFKRADQVRVRSGVILTVAETAREQGIDLALPTRVVLFHDQPEEGDGD